MKKAICIPLIALVWLTTIAAIPVQTETVNQDGRQLVIKTFELPPGEDPTQLIEEPFEADGFSYTYLDTVKQEVPYEDHKSVTQNVTVKTGSDKTDEILKKLSASIPYDESGFTGTLTLDTNSIKTEAEGYTTSSYVITDTQTFANLEHNDPSLIPQTTKKNGLTLKLANVNWKGQDSVSDSLIPTNYTATATYRGTGSTKTATGYITAASYTGDVTNSGIRKIKYNVSYLGKEPPPFPWHWVWIGGGFVLLVIGAITYLIFRCNVKVYRAFAGQDDYILVGRQRLTTKKPFIFLTGLKRPIIGEAAISVRKGVAKKLLGRQIIIETQSGVRTHTVQTCHTDYWFTINTQEEEQP